MRSIRLRIKHPGFRIRPAGVGQGFDATPRLDAPPGRDAHTTVLSVERHAAPTDPAPMRVFESNA